MHQLHMWELFIGVQKAKETSGGLFDLTSAPRLARTVKLVFLSPALEGSMKRTHVDYVKGFHIILGDEHSQAGTLVIAPGCEVGGAHNSHAGADQWIYVVSGRGAADVAGETFALEPHALVLIQRRDPHGFRNTGSEDLCLLTFYVPPAYDEHENELPAGLP